MIGKRAKINKIMAEFDFRVVKDCMQKCGIIWKNKDGLEYIPAQSEIELKAKQMLEAATNSSTNYYKLTSDNLMVRKSNVSLELGFFVEYRWA